MHFTKRRSTFRIRLLLFVHVRWLGIFCAKSGNNCGMKKQTTIDEARAEVASLFGKSVSVRQNRGRNRIKYYKGVVSEIHDNVFVIALQGDLFDRLSCSYVDVVCGEIRMKPREE